MRFLKDKRTYWIALPVLPVVPVLSVAPVLPVAPVAPVLPVSRRPRIPEHDIRTETAGFAADRPS